MRKNVLSVFFVSILSTNIIMPVMAESNVITIDGSSSTTITKEISSSYSVLIPQSVNLSSDNASISVQAKGNIEPDKELSVTTTNEVLMTRANDTTYSGKATISLEGTIWDSTTLTNEYDTKNGTIAFPEAKAGSYSGTLNFDINLNKKKTEIELRPGSYIKDILNKSKVTSVTVSSSKLPESININDTTDITLAKDKTAVIYINDTNATIYPTINNAKIMAFENSMNMFGVETLTSIDLKNLDVSNVQYMNYMFAFSSITDYSSIKDWNVSNVDYMNRMFFKAKITDLIYFKDWDISNGVILDSMFLGSNVRNINGLENWDVSKVNQMQWMFMGCLSLTSLEPLFNWNTSKVFGDGMNNMFTDVPADVERPVWFLEYEP